MACVRIPLSIPHFGQVSFWLFPLLSVPHPPTHLHTKKNPNYNLRETFQWLKVKSCKSCHISLHRFLNLAFIVERFHSLNNYLRSPLQSVQTTRHPKVCVDSIPFCFCFFNLQWMVTGAIGINGQRVLRPVGRGHRSGFAHVTIPNHCIGESSVKVRHKKPVFVIQENAQVCF